MICTFMLTMLVIYLPYVGAKIGASCQGDSDCVTSSEACSSQGLCQCNRIHIYPSFCNSESAHSGPCPNISECMVCNTSIGFGTCMCNPVFYEYQGSCYLKGDHNDTCYTAEGCTDTGNLVCSNSSGGICVCRTGYYWHHYGRCAEKVPVGGGCYMPDACRDDHARCTSLSPGPPVCNCMDGFYAHQGSCILKGNHNDTCYTAEGCRDTMNLVCSNSSGGKCVCRTGFYLNHYGRCTEMPEAPKNLLVLNVTSRAFTIWLEKPNEVFGELLGYVLTIKLADTGRCVIEYLIRCGSGCANPFPNQTALVTTCPFIIQYRSVNKQDLVMMKSNINTLDPGTVYWVSVAAVGQYGKGFTADINVTTLHEGDINVGSHLEFNSITTIIIVSIACGTLIIIVLMTAVR